MILDIDDMRHPKYVSGLDWSPPYPCPTHTVLPIPHELMGRKIAVVTDEEVSDRLTPSPNAFMWIVDITDEKHPMPVATWRVPHDEPFNRDCWFGAHQPQETVNGNIILVTWFGGGLRAVDISNPYRPEEVEHFMPTPGAGQKIVQSNDVFVDKTRGLVLPDRPSQRTRHPRIRRLSWSWSTRIKAIDSRGDAPFPPVGQGGTTMATASAPAPRVGVRLFHGAAVLGFVLAIAALVMLAAGPLGWRAGWWHFPWASKR